MPIYYGDENKRKAQSNKPLINIYSQNCAKLAVHCVSSTFYVYAKNG